jgi:hypothetical protein
MSGIIIVGGNDSLYIQQGVMQSGGNGPADPIFIDSTYNIQQLQLDVDDANNATLMGRFVSQGYVGMLPLSISGGVVTGGTLLQVGANSHFPINDSFHARYKVSDGSGFQKLAIWDSSTGTKLSGRAFDTDSGGSPANITAETIDLVESPTSKVINRPHGFRSIALNRVGAFHYEAGTQGLRYSVHSVTGTANTTGEAVIAFGSTNNVIDAADSQTDGRGLLMHVLGGTGTVLRAYSLNASSMTQSSVLTISTRLENSYQPRMIAVLDSDKAVIAMRNVANTGWILRKVSGTEGTLALSGSEFDTGITSFNEVCVSQLDTTRVMVWRLDGGNLKYRVVDCSGVTPAYAAAEVTVKAVSGSTFTSGSFDVRKLSDGTVVAAFLDGGTINFTTVTA